MLNSELPCQIQDLAPEILRQIFVECLPSNPLSHRQSKGQVAPILLCHVSSYWRAVALETVHLWIHLNHLMNESWSVQPGKSEIDPNIKFLRWWMQNLRGNSLILRLQLELSYKQKVGALTMEEKDTFLQLLSSAHYIDMTKDCARAITKYIGKAVPDEPILDTLIIRDAKMFGNQGTHINFTADDVPFKRHPIRRLFLSVLNLPIDDFSAITWLHLTHAVLTIRITKPIWFSLIREFSTLQFGRFNLEIREPYYIFHQNPTSRVPPMRTLPELRQLVLSVKDSSYSMGADHLFKNLEFPALTALRLDSRSRGTTHEALLSMLESTPSLKELHLGFDIPRDMRGTHRSIFDSNIKPLTTRIPLLKRLVLRLRDEEIKDFDSWHCCLVTCEWLGLGKPSNCIEQVEFTLDPTETLCYYHKLEILGILRERALEGVAFTLTDQATSPWNLSRQFGVLEDNADCCFEKMMFNEVL